MNILNKLKKERQRRNAINSQKIDDILTDYRKLIDIIDSVRYTDQIDAARNCIVSVLSKHMRVNELMDFNDFGGRLKRVLKGTYKRDCRIIGMLDAVNHDASARVTKRSNKVSDLIVPENGRERMQRIRNEEQKIDKKIELEKRQSEIDKLFDHSFILSSISTEELEAELEKRKNKQN